MSLDVALHDFIDDYNILTKPTQEITAFFKEHPDCFKATLLANHLFRAFAMAAMTSIMPFSTPVNLAICFAGSLFYRLTVETNCAYKFALPAFAGSLVLPLAMEALKDIATGIAFTSLSSFGAAFLSLASLSAYVAYIVLTVSYDVDNR